MPRRKRSIGATDQRGIRNVLQRKKKSGLYYHERTLCAEQQINETDEMEEQTER